MTTANVPATAQRHASLVLLAVGLLFACSGASSSTRPVPSVAVSLEAQSSFQPIRERWLLSTAEERVLLEPRLEAFRLRFARDPLARVAQAYLAFIALHRNDRDRAVGLARKIREGPVGNTRDLGVLVDGACLAHAGKPEEALQRLDPLVGKMIDAFAQDLLHEAVATAAVDAHRWYQAVAYMNEWFRSTNEQDVPAVRARVDRLLAAFPAGSLESSLRAIGAARQKELWEPELRDALAARLAAVAMERSDPDLARSVLETSRTFVGLGDQGTSLAQLATSGGNAPRVIGARVGLVLDSRTSLSAERSAQAVAGALQVFPPVRDMDPDVGRPAPPVLITRSIPPDGSIVDAIDDLAYQGAAIVIAGFDGVQSSEAARYAETHSLPILLVVAPDRLPKNARFSFIVGTGSPRWLRPIATQAASQVHPDHSARVATGEPPDHPLATSCSRPTPRAGEPAFPVSLWRASNIRSVAIDGPAWCAEAVLADLRASRFSPPVLLGLEAREARGDAKAYPGELLVATCGLLDAPASAQPPSITAWRADHGKPPTWLEAVGRDAAALAHLAVDPLPRDTFIDAAQVSLRRAEAQMALASVQTELWTTSARGFSGSRALNRSVRFEHAR